MFDFTIGDWVYATQSGVWQIYRIDEFRAFNPSTKEFEDKSLIFAKRFFDDKGKAAFTQDFFSITSLFPVKGESKLDLDLYIKSHPRLYAKFNRYNPEPIDTVCQCWIDVPEHQSTEEIADMFPKNVEYTQSEAAQLINALGLDLKSSPHWTVEFISRGTVLRDGYIRYVFNRVLEF
ncbi:hypothetical protein [Enterovibrio nigricans]|uniref:Uncharacterized protein n=1 Tax=Enterovibrio nigricans DSM 22720 TaxID=1121868 RepID=A0A1T4V0U2_9GAMM|nr:hypothetical protein [Enterovibrio nigricans]SKA58261.1 hypothetical protein SAMN02745132_02908 [Enterovibrio nigricans DSM 22720]